MAGLTELEKNYQLALKGNPNALDEVSKKAFGGNIRAKEMIREIENHKIVFIEVVEETSKMPKRSNLGQIIFHPLESLLTKIRQIQISVDMAQAPVGCNIEEFPKLSISEAAALLRKKKNIGGVPFEAWTIRDQKRIEAGLKPKSYPEHPNV